MRQTWKTNERRPKLKSRAKQEPNSQGKSQIISSSAALAVHTAQSRYHLHFTAIFIIFEPLDLIPFAASGSKSLKTSYSRRSRSSYQDPKQWPRYLNAWMSQQKPVAALAQFARNPQIGTLPTSVESCSLHNLSQTETGSHFLRRTEPWTKPYT